MEIANNKKALATPSYAIEWGERTDKDFIWSVSGQFCGVSIGHKSW